jgi:ABC-type uncharacterized transport system auxiliary subunit
MRASTLLLALALAACAKAPPVPTDRYYRLSEPTIHTSERLWPDRIIAIAPFSGDGLQHDRAIAYSRNDDGALQQYHYHFWLDSPTKLLQQHLADYLRASGVGRTVTKVDADIIIFGRVKRFERSIDDNDYRSVVAVQVRVDNSTGRHPLLIKDYASEITNSGAGMEYAVQAFDQAVTEVLEQFCADLRLVDNSRADP